MADQHPVSSALELLLGILEREKARGTDHLYLSEDGENRLSEMPLEFLRLSQEASSAKIATIPKETNVSSVIPSVQAEASSEPTRPERSEEWARKELNAIFREVKSSNVCRDLGTLRETVVFATGNPLADLMFVGEAPGAEEEKERKPFVGPAGQKLTQIIQAMGLSREEVYISNIVKFRPKKGDGRFQGTSNRKPDVTEMAACIPYIRREIEVVGPKVIVALGATAAEGLLERGGTISRLREQSHEFAGVPVIVTYHPSYLLRQESETDPQKAKAAKRKVWEDMLKAMGQLGMSVSEKQRNFFS